MLSISPKVALAADFDVLSFHSQLNLKQNTDVEIVETIQVNFMTSKHGIYRFIPTDGIEITNVEVRDENNQNIPNLARKSGSNLEIKIGDPNKTFKGNKTYKITYTVKDLLEEYPDYFEIYWNVTGSKWETNIKNPSVSVTSNFANIEGTACFTGLKGNTESDCETSYGTNSAIASSRTDSGQGEDFTIVVVFQKSNNLIFPGFLSRTISELRSLGFYILAAFPAVFMLFNWYKKGRDITYGNKVYYGEKHDISVKPLWSRNHLPTVYMPIDGLTPAQVGALVDESVDIKDISAEIVELARLKYLRISALEKKFLSNQEYKIEKLKEPDDNLLDYQKYLIESLFPIGQAGQLKTSEFKKIKFYNYLPEIKKKLYQSLVDEKLFYESPDKTRVKWTVTVMILIFVTCLIVFKNVNSENFIYPAIIGISSALASFLAVKMPRKTAKGYALYLQVKGLKKYLEIGKWRHEIYEKNLFLEEMIPLAISLGVVNKLSSQMKDLGINPEKISSNYVIASSGFNNLEKSLSASLLSGAPRSSSSGWSGGSSGGGFGGGGGGSW